MEEEEDYYRDLQIIVAKHGTQQREEILVAHACITCITTNIWILLLFSSENSKGLGQGGGRETRGLPAPMCRV
jgi:hypothetical protein